MTRFLVEMSQKSETFIHPTPSNDYDKKYNIYELNINEYPKDTYWEEWGGYYDNFIGTQIELYYSQFLQKVNNESEVLATPFSMHIKSDLIVLLNVSKHPWLYPDYSTETEDVIPFLSSALNPDNPSNNIIRTVAALTRLEIPYFTIKLSDNISGMTLNQGFNISLINNDGYFDDEEKWNLFNTPIYIKKAIVENPEYEDFKTIRSGLVENISSDYNSFQITVSDKLRAMGEPICNIIKQSEFLGVIIEEKYLNKNIPVIYGTKKIKLLKLDETHYVGAEFISSVLHVFNRDGENITWTYNSITNIIETVVEADSAIITGYTENKIGEVIKDIITRKTNIQFNNSNWNEEEINEYINRSPRINTSITSGNVKNAVQDILKNDMAFFIQQVDGRFTIRKYGMNYDTHYIPSWVITQRPEKSWDNAQENYFSSCIINYGNIDDNEINSFLYAERENEAENMYRRIVKKIFDTELVELQDAKNLAELLSDRYTTMKQTLKLAIGIDTSNFELLDYVVLPAKINDREFSKQELWLIKEINPAQDILTLESVNIIDLSGEYPDTQNYEEDYDGLYAYTNDSEYELIVDEGVL